MSYKNVLLALLVTLIPGISLAEKSSNSYIGINSASFDSKYHSTEYDGLMLNLGVDLNNYIALELAAGGSSSTDDPITLDSSKIDYAASAFLRFNLRFNRIVIYALGGYSQSESSTTASGTTTSVTDSGSSYGYGIDFYGTYDLALSFRRVEFYDNEEPTGNSHLGATMMGITYYFDAPKIRSRY